MRKVPLVNFRGNRFNILFFNAVYCYFLHREMRDFLSLRKDRNGLLQAVFVDLNVQGNIAGLKCLGLVSKLLTGPLWRLLADDELDMVEFGGVIKTVLDNLDKVASTPDGVESFLDGTAVLSPRKEWTIKKDAIYNELKAPNNRIDSECAAFLSVLLPSFLSWLFREHFQLQIGFSEKDGVEKANAKDKHPLRTNVCLRRFPCDTQAKH